MDAEDHLARASRNALLALGDDAIPVLVGLIGDPALLEEGSPGDGWVPIHAADLLGELGAVAAIPPLLRLLKQADAMDVVYAAAVRALAHMGGALVEPGLKALASASSGDFRDGLIEALAEARVLDPRILSTLLVQLEEDAELGATNLAGYGDVEALPALARTFSAWEPDDLDLPGAGEVVLALVDAMWELGGKLTADQAAILHVVIQARLVQGGRRPGFRRGSVTPRPPHERPRSHEPCWCNSGRRYRECHREDDETAWFDLA